MNNIETLISKTLLNLGIPPHTKGYHYLRKGIAYYISVYGSTINFNKQLYPVVADSYNSTVCSVERAVRHSIQTSWHKRDMRFAHRVFANLLQSEKDIPTNTLFIAAVSEWIVINSDVKN